MIISIGNPFSPPCRQKHQVLTLEEAKEIVGHSAILVYYESVDQLPILRRALNRLNRPEVREKFINSKLDPDLHRTVIYVCGNGFELAKVEA